MDFNAQPSSSPSSSNVKKMESRNKKALAVLEMDNQQPSTSSSTLSKKQQEMNKIEDEQKGKKLKEELQSESEDQDAVENNSFIDELPPEMLMKILKCLNAKSLAASRLVSRKWNGMAREVLKSSDDAETVFTCRKTEDGNFEIVGKTRGSSLKNFSMWFDESKDDLLYTRFRFDDIEPLFFVHTDWLKFTSSFGSRVKSVRLMIQCDLIIILEKLANMLLNQLPNLQEFGLDIRYSYDSSEHQLFPTTTSTVQLPNLKVVYLDEFFFSKYTGIVADLLLAAVNLQKIKHFVKYNYYSRFETFHFIQSFEKLHCLQSAKIWLHTHFMSKIQGQSPMAFKLKKLKLLVVLSDEEAEACGPDAPVFISHLFEPSKDTLTELEMDSLEFLPDLRLPKFSKLSRLTIVNRLYGQEIQVLPSGINLMETFPVLQFLESGMPWDYFFPDDQVQNVYCLKNLRTLVITGRGLTKEGIFGISQVCPNLKELRICDSEYGWAIKNFPEVGQAIWTRLTKLESLHVWIDMNSPANAFPAVDSTFTGFSGEDVIRLYDLIENEKADKKQGSQVKSESKKQLEAERKTRLILDLKDLRKLTVHYFYKRAQKSAPVRKNLLVSEECAFKLMENLTYRFYYKTKAKIYSISFIFTTKGIMIIIIINNNIILLYKLQITSMNFQFSGCAK